MCRSLSLSLSLTSLTACSYSSTLLSYATFSLDRVARKKSVDELRITHAKFAIQELLERIERRWSTEAKRTLLKRMAATHDASFKPAPRLLAQAAMIPSIRTAVSNSAPVVSPDPRFLDSGQIVLAIINPGNRGQPFNYSLSMTTPRQIDCTERDFLAFVDYHYILSLFRRLECALISVAKDVSKRTVLSEFVRSSPSLLNILDNAEAIFVAYN